MILQCDQHIGTNIISLEVIFIYENTSYIYWQLKINQNAYLISFVESCKQKMQSMDENNGTIDYIEIGDQKYDQTDQRNLKCLGVSNRQKVSIHISRNPDVSEQQDLIIQNKLNPNHSNEIKAEQQTESANQNNRIEKQILIGNKFQDQNNQEIVEEYEIHSLSEIKIYKQESLLVNQQQNLQTIQFTQVNGISCSTHPMKIIINMGDKEQIQTDYTNSKGNVIKDKSESSTNRSDRQMCNYQQNIVKKDCMSPTMSNQILTHQPKQNQLNNYRNFQLYNYQQNILKKDYMPPTMSNQIITHQPNQNQLNNYKNILFQNQQRKQQNFVKGRKIIIQNFTNPEVKQNFNNLTYKENTYHEINNSFRKSFQQKKLMNSIIEPHLSQQQNNSKKFDQNLAMFVLSDQLNKQGQKLYKTECYDQLNILSLQASFAYGLDHTTCMQLTIPNNKYISYQFLKQQEYLRNFKAQITQDIALSLNVNPDSINLLQIEEASSQIQFSIQNFSGIREKIQWNKSIVQLNKKYPDSQLVLNHYFQEIHLSDQDFDPKYNIEWDMNYKEWELRGPKYDQIKYFFPRGWKGYALNVVGKYDEGNNDWLAMNDNQNQWHIMYHGTKKEHVREIVEQGLQPGRAQQYRDSTDIRKLQKVGSGVYFTNHIEVAEKYCKTTTIDGYSYYVIFQSRVNPKKLKQIQKKSDIQEKQGHQDWDNDYFVVNEPQDIRPYRILLKTIRDQSNNIKTI